MEPVSAATPRRTKRTRRVRAARFTVSAELLAEVLNMPKGSTIIGAAFMHSGHGGIELVVDHPDMPESTAPTECLPTLKRIEWDWGLPPVVNLDPGCMA
jgi:hypothetical protein